MKKKRPRRAGPWSMLAGVLMAIVFFSACADEEDAAVPPSVEAAGEHAEGAYEAVFAGDWGGAHILADSLDADVRAMESELGQTEAAESQISTPLLDLGTALASRARPDALRFSNEITRRVALFEAAYRPALPVGIALLDCYGREVQWLSETNDIGSMDRAVGGLRGVWDATRATVESRDGGGTEARAFEELVRQAEATTGQEGTAAFESLSVRILDQVDALEGLFPTGESPD